MFKPLYKIAKIARKKMEDDSWKSEFESIKKDMRSFMKRAESIFKRYSKLYPVTHKFGVIPKNINAVKSVKKEVNSLHRAYRVIDKRLFNLERDTSFTSDYYHKDPISYKYEAAGQKVLAATKARGWSKDISF